jgi:uncharacterized delta-60 repeat protein
MNTNNQPAAPQPQAAFELTASRGSRNVSSNKEFAMIQHPKNKLRFAVISCLLSIALMSCNTVSNLPKPTSTPNPILGVLEVHVDGGRGAEATASAKMMNSGSSSRSISAVSETGLSLSRREVSFTDVGNPGDLNAMRYVQATFELTNASNRSFDNLSLVAISLAGSSLEGTAIGALADARGVPITTNGVARGMMPSHGMQSLRIGLGVNPETADLQFFSQAEISLVQAQSVNLIPAIVGDVLQYGYVTHNFSGARNIGASGCVGSNCNKGVVTLAFKMPLAVSRASNPWSFTTYFVVTDQTETITSQSLEEQAACTVTGQTQYTDAVTSNIKVRTLQGSSYHGANLERLPGIRTAGSIAAPLASLPLPAAIAPGSLDTTCFAAGGQVITDLAGGQDQGKALALFADGSSIVAGTTAVIKPITSNPNNLYKQFLLLKYKPDGTLDQRFGTNGHVITGIDSGSVNVLFNIQANALAIQADGKIVVAGTMFIEPSGGRQAPGFVLARYNKDGSLDNTFGNQGLVLRPFTGGNPPAEQALALAIQSTGKIVVTGIKTVPNSIARGVITRYTTDGAIDTSFGTSGSLDLQIEGHSLKVQSDDGILVAGGNSNSQALAVQKLLANGVSDRVFGNNGLSLIQVQARPAMVNDMVVQPDGKIVLAGYRSTPSQLILARLGSDGRIDPSFGTLGLAEVIRAESANAVGLAPDGSLLAAGFYRNQLLLARYTSAGRLDSSFGTNGIQASTIGTGRSIANAMGIRADGKIVITGVTGSNNQLNDDDVLLSQYNP